MLLILPPSETKRSGGAPGSRLQLDSLSFPELTAERRIALEALDELGRDPESASRALKLGPTQGDELERNRSVRSSPTMPALDRFDGVLFDALDAASLGASSRRRAAHRLVIASALFGLVGAMDAIPAYRLSHDSRLAGLSLARHWRGPVAAALEHAAAGRLVLDLRSEAYVGLGPAPVGSWYLRVVTEAGGGRRRALNHFNKAAKGRLSRALIELDRELTSLDELCDWARETGFRIEAADVAGELLLIV